MLTLKGGNFINKLCFQEQMSNDGMHEECGVFGVYANEPSAVGTDVYYGLYALQHRGQQSCGIVVNNDGVFNYHKGLGLLNEVFDADILENLGTGKIAMGHVRYSAPKFATPHNNQPLVIRHTKGPMSLATNGNLLNAEELKEAYELKGGIFHASNDAEVITYAITEQRLVSPSIEVAVEKAMYKLKGAYSLVIMSARKLIAARDPYGFRPLCIGQLPDNGGYVFTSESCALDSISATFLRDVLPGEIVYVDHKGELQSIKTHCGKPCSMCIFEYVYFARPDSIIEGTSVHEARKTAGRLLAKKDKVQADIVIGVPDSGLDAALGYAEESKIPYGVGFIKNRYVGRTFIAPSQHTRENLVRIKLNPLSAVVTGKRVIMIDDSIVRGTTSANIIKLLRAAGATEVHVRISSPPFVNPCYFGTDIDSRENLIACRMSLEDICKTIGADSLAYLSTDDVKKIAGNEKTRFCTGCFDGKYPVPVPEEKPYDKYDKKITN